MRRIIISLSIMCILLWITFREGELTSPHLGKTKLSYASSQNATLQHISPKRDVTLDMFTVSAIKNRMFEEMNLVGSPSLAPTSAPTSAPISTPKYTQSTENTTENTTKENTKKTTESVIVGQIDITPEMRSQFKSSSTLFVIVRTASQNGQPGSMIAALKHEGLSLADFPFSYKVTQQNSMTGAPLSGEVQLSARLDQDGDAISKQPGDLVGEAPSASKVGSSPINFSLNATL